MLILTGSIWGCALSKSDIGEPEELEFGIVNNRLADFRDSIRKDLRVAVGSFLDKTGQFKDSSGLRYSTAVTKGAMDVLAHVLYQALGPRALVERDPQNLQMIQREYELSYKFDKEGRRIGLIQKGGPKGGMVGAEYLVTGAIVYYNVDRVSGGGGVNIDGIGGAVRFSYAKVSVELRLVDMSSSEVIWSTIQESDVKGYKVSADIFRFITSSGSDFLVQAEAGIAAQLPADYAVHTSLEQAVTNMILENDKIFLESKTG